jgi:hypothetical protein
MERFEARSKSNEGISQLGIPAAVNSQVGIHAYKTSHHALGNLEHYCYRGALLGMVKLWGTIQEHQFGFRAEYGYPVSLTMGICCICKSIVNLKSEPFTIPFTTDWIYFHFSETFTVTGFLCIECSEKYYSVDIESSYNKLTLLANSYGITIN